MKKTDLKFNYDSAELYISKPNIYGSRLFVLVDIENETIVSGWSASSPCEPYRCNYKVVEDTTQKHIKEIYKHMKARGYKEIKEREFYQARENAKQLKP